MPYSVKDPALCQADGIFKVSLVDPVYIHARPVFRLVVKSKIVHKVHAAQQEIKALILCQFRGQFFKFREVAYFQSELDLDRELLLPDFLN